MKTFPAQVSSDMVLLAFIYIAGTLAVFVLILGLCLIDAGLVRRKNVLHTWIQKLTAAFVAGLGQAIGGYALWQYTFNNAFGVPAPFGTALKDWWVGGAFLNTHAALINPNALPEADTQQVFFVFFVTFSMAVAALIHSSVVERIRSGALYAMSFVLGLIVVPVVAFLTWGPLSPLTARGLHDFEGVLTIYVFAGTWALVLAWRLRPRLGMHAPHASGARPVPHNLSLVGAGALLFMIALPLVMLASGFIAPGQGYYGIDYSTSGIGTVLSGIVLAMIGGGVVGAVLAHARREAQWVFFGPVTGVVICGSIIDVAKPWWCLLLGAAGPVVALATMRLMIRLRVDELKVVPLALGPGIVGMIAGGFIAWGTPTGGYPGLTGTYALGRATITPAWQLLGVVIVVAIAAAGSFVFCLVTQALGKLRVDEDHEVAGGDLTAWGTDNYGHEPLITAAAAAAGTASIDNEPAGSRK